MSSPPPRSAGKTVAIKPKTVRLRPLPNYYALENVASKGSSGISCPEVSRDVQAPAQLAPEQPTLSYSNLPAQSSQQNSASHIDVIQIHEPSSFVSQDTESDTKAQQSSSAGDGYNWRKYGQKQVKGSEYPRSYYKCTYPSCLVKKKLERSFDGQIAEIVYEGQHNHPKPHPPKKMIASASGSQGQTTTAAADHGGDDHLPLSTSSAHEGINNAVSHAGRMDNCSSYSAVELSGFLSDPAQGYFVHDHHHLVAANSESTAVRPQSSIAETCKIGRRMANMESSKRRKTDDRVDGANVAARSSEAGGPHFTTHNSTEPETTSGDGFHWRKYGQKVVKGNTHPRSYYKCTSPRCNVRKYVERTSDESGSFVTTYEGKHNHEMPTPK